MFSFKVSDEEYNFRNYNLSMQQYCDKLNVGLKRFYLKLREMGVFDGDNEPTPEYSKFFNTRYTWYSEKSGKPSYYITAEGEEFIRNLFSEEELKAISKSKYARVRKLSNYKYY